MTGFWGVCGSLEVWKGLRQLLNSFLGLLGQGERPQRARCRLLATTLLFVNAQAWAGSWSRVVTHGDPPSARSRPAVGAIGASVFLFGGVYDDFSTGRNQFYNDLFRFDQRDGRWTRLKPIGDLPPTRAFAAAAADPDSELFFIYGGARYGSNLSELVAYNDLWVYSPLLNRWTKLRPANAGPSGRARPTAWLIRGQLYLFGGIDVALHTLNDLWRYDLEANRWTLLLADGAAGSPPCRHEAQAGTRSRFGKVVIYGGESFDGKSFGTLNDTWEYDLARNQWAEITPAHGWNIQPARNYGAAGVLGPNLYLQGGDLPGGVTCCGAPFAQNPTAELWRFDLEKKIWEPVTCSAGPVRLKRHCAIEVGNELFFFCGFDFEPEGAGQIWNHNVFVFRP